MFFVLLQEKLGFILSIVKIKICFGCGGFRIANPAAKGWRRSLISTGYFFSAFRWKRWKRVKNQNHKPFYIVLLTQQFVKKQVLNWIAISGRIWQTASRQDWDSFWWWQCNMWTENYKVFSCTILMMQPCFAVVWSRPGFRNYPSWGRNWGKTATET